MDIFTGVFSRLNRLWLGMQRADLIGSFSDPELGSLEPSSDAEWWQIRKAVGDSWIMFNIGGDREPNSEIIKTVRTINARLASLTHDAVEFLAKEEQKKQLLYYSEEIKALKVESINVLWPDNPRQTEIEFSGGHSGRLWACAYENGTFFNLGFDN